MGNKEVVLEKSPFWDYLRSVWVPILIKGELKPIAFKKRKVTEKGEEK